MRNSAGTALGPGIDVRGDGGYVIAPPSVHASGEPYRWSGPANIPDLPSHLLELLREPPPPPHRRPHAPTEPPRLDRALSAWAARALTDESHHVAQAAPGVRNHLLNRAAFSLGQIVATGLLDEDTVVSHLHHAATGVGLGARESRATIRSGLTAGMRNPRLPAGRTDTANVLVDRDPVLDIESASI